jgi:hypothetical protein
VKGLDKDKEKVESHHERNVRQEVTLHKARMLVHKGLTAFEYNKKTGVLKKAEFYETEVQMMDNPFAHALEPARKMLTVKKVKDKPNCLYMQKLNFKNAIKLIEKLGYTNILIQK